MAHAQMMASPGKRRVNAPLIKKPQPGTRAPAPRPAAQPTKFVGNVSELYMRLRAARRHADLTQQDIATRIQKSRATIALWESDNDEIRTRPGVEYVRQFAQICGVPVGFLMDNTARPEDLQKYIDQDKRGGSATGVNLSGDAYAADANSARIALLGLDDQRAAGFWAAVYFHLAEKSSTRMSRFARQQNAYMPDYVHNGNAVVFASDMADAKSILVGSLAVLLHSEKITGERYNQHVLVFAGHGGAKINATEAKELWGVSVKQVDKLQDAVKYLQAL